MYIQEVGSFKNKKNREGGGGGGGGGDRTTDLINLLQSYNILHRLQLHHLTLPFTIHNKIFIKHTIINNLSKIYLLMIILCFVIIDIRYKLLGTYDENKRSRQ